MQMLSAILANVLLFTAAMGFGSVLRRFFPENFSRIDCFALMLLGGLGLLGTLLFDIGQVWFSRTTILLILSLGVLLALDWLLRTRRSLGSRVPRARWPVIPGLVVGGVLLVTAVGGLAEPTGDIKMDAIAYHFLGPKVWLRNRVIRPVIDESYTAFPATVETQYAALMAFGGQRAPEFFAVIALFSMLIVSGALSLRSGLHPRDAWWVAALVVTMPVLYRGAYGGFIDVVYSGFVLAAARVGFDVKTPRHYVLFGIFSGFAVGTKYTGLIAGTLLMACVFIIAISVHKQNAVKTLQYLCITCVAACIVAAPWYLRNWILLGCPIYPPPPVLLRFFHVRYLPPEALQSLLERVSSEWQGMGKGPLNFLLLPFHLTFYPANFLNGAGGIGLAPLALAPLGILACRANWFARALGLFALLQTAAWFVTAQEARFLIHVYAILAIFAVWGWKYAVRTASRFGRVLAELTVACSILYGSFMIASARAEDVHAALSKPFAQKRRLEEVPFASSFDYLNNEVSVQRVLILDPHVPPYFCEKDYLKPVGRRGELALPEANNLPLLLSELPRLQVSHVLDVRWDNSAFRIPDHPRGLTLVFDLDDQRIYRVD